MHDRIIRGGTLIDGTGAPARLADVAIDAGVIVEVGDDLGDGREVIDASGLRVSPGYALPLVSAPGIEPGTGGLRVRCSAS